MRCQPDEWRSGIARRYDWGVASDDEIERRLQALKGGPASAGGSASGSASGSTGGPASTDAPLVGEVLEPGDGTFSGPASGRRSGSSSGPPGAAPGVGTRVVHWSFDQASAGRLGLWFGVLLVAIGTYFVVVAFFPGVRIVGSLGIAVAGLLLLGAALTHRAGDWARTLGAVLVGYGVLPFVAGLAGLGTNGWGSLGAGLALLLLGLLRARGARGFGWYGPVGGFLAIWGAWGVVGTLIPGFPSLGDLIVPAILVLIGIVVLRRGVAGPPTR